MAVTAVNARTARIPAGPYWMQTFMVTTSAADQTGEYFVTGFENIVAVIGDALMSDTASAKTTNYVKNARGTAGTAGDYPGDLGIEAEVGDDFEVTVLGN